MRAPVFPDLGALDRAAQLAGDQLHAVTDPQHRDPELEQPRVELRRPIGVHGRGTAREDQADRVATRDLLWTDVVGQQRREHAALAHAPCDQLAVLPPVVEYHHLLGTQAVAGGHFATGDG